MAVCPFADQSYRYDRNYGGSYVDGPWRGVLHSTETTGRPGYDNGATAPHITIDPRGRRGWQHYDTARPARALKHPSGTVETNNLRCVQFEIIAYSDEAIARRVGGVAVSQLTDADLAYIARYMRWAEDAHGIKPTSGLTFKPYPASAGTANGVRMSTAEWRKFNGWAGHQHVPNNVHGDPSNLPIARLLEDDMPMTDAEKNEIADLVVSKLLRAPIKNSHDGSTASFAAYVVYGNEAAHAARDQAAAAKGAALGAQAGAAAAAAAAVKQALADGVVSVDVNVQGVVKP